MGPEDDGDSAEATSVVDWHRVRGTTRNHGHAATIASDQRLPVTGLDEVAIARLRHAGLRPTRQRRDLAELLFAGGKEALTAEALHALALHQGIRVSLATVYGTLHSFRDVGLVREISIDSKRYFDINIDNHQYFYYEEERRLVGVTEAETGVTQSPQPPAGRKVSRIDIVVRLRHA